MKIYRLKFICRKVYYWIKIIVILFQVSSGVNDQYTSFYDTVNSGQGGFRIEHSIVHDRNSYAEVSGSYTEEIDKMKAFSSASKA